MGGSIKIQPPLVLVLNKRVYLGVDLSRLPRYLCDNAQSQLYFEVCFPAVNTGIVIFADGWTDVCTVFVD